MARRVGYTSEYAKLKAIGHPTRRKVLEIIAGRGENGDAISPLEIAGLLDVPLTNVSYHVRVLAACEAITLAGTKPVRGSRQHFYLPSPQFLALPWVALILESSRQANPSSEVA